MSSLHRTTKVSPLVETMVSGDQRAGIGGILVNDINGLCLISKGKMSSENTPDAVTSDNHDDIDSGVYTSLTRLASSLTPCQAASTNNENPPSPLITIEMDGPSSIIIKEYDGHTVALRVPNQTAKN